jgi:hypothetical protein
MKGALARAGVRAPVTEFKPHFRLTLREWVRCLERSDATCYWSCRAGATVRIKGVPILTVTALDTHEVVKELRAVGFTDEQAEAVTRVIRRSQDIDLSNLATKADLQLTRTELQNGLENGLASVRADLQNGLASVRADLQLGLASAKSDLQIGLAETKAEILKWMVGTIGVQTVVILGAVVALPRFVPH